MADPRFQHFQGRCPGSGFRGFGLRKGVPDWDVPPYTNSSFRGILVLPIRIPQGCWYKGEQSQVPDFSVIRAVSRTLQKGLRGSKKLVFA